MILLLGAVLMFLTVFALALRYQGARSGPPPLTAEQLNSVLNPVPNHPQWKVQFFEPRARPKPAHDGPHSSGGVAA